MRLLAIFLVFGLFIASCDSDDSDSLGVQLKLQKKELSNGLTVIMVEDHTVPIVTYQTWFRVGSVDERIGMTGISHLFEHLMFKGTPKYGAKEFFKQLETKGAEVNAFTTRDYTVYYENFVPALLEKVIDMESDRMNHLVLDEAVLKTERMVVLEERRLRTENSPEGRMQEAIWQLAYHRHPYQWPVIGYPMDLMGITPALLQSYYKAHYHPGNAAVVIVGDFDSDQTFSLIKSAYGKLPAHARPIRKIVNEPEQKEERRLVMRDKVASEKFAQAYHISSATDDDSYALDVLANVLFDGINSRGYKRLVEDKEFMIGVSGSAFTPTFPGLFQVFGTMRAGVPAARAEAELDRLISEVQGKPVSDGEIQIAIKKLTVQLVDSVRTPFGLGQFIGTVQTIMGDPNRIYSDLKKYTQVKAADVQRVAQKYLNPNNRSVVTLLPGT